MRPPQTRYNPNQLHWSYTSVIRWVEMAITIDYLKNSKSLTTYSTSITAITTFQVSPKWNSSKNEFSFLFGEKFKLENNDVNGVDLSKRISLQHEFLCFQDSRMQSTALSFSLNTILVDGLSGLMQSFLIVVLRNIFTDLHVFCG